MKYAIKFEQFARLPSFMRLSLVSFQQLPFGFRHALSVVWLRYDANQERRRYADRSYEEALSRSRNTTADAGILGPEDRVELIDGEVLQMTPRRTPRLIVQI